MQQLCFATHNRHKVAEIRQLLGGASKILSLDDLGITTEIPETGTTLAENAFIKANYVFQQHGIPCFADDTGLEVAALNGAPGVYSARFAGEPADNEKNIDKLLALLAGQNNRQARFKTVIALVQDDGRHFFEGTVEGEIIAQRRGNQGFGYDAVFLPKNFDRTFAEMDLNEKNKISHRARAVARLVAFLKHNQ